MRPTHPWGPSLAVVFALVATGCDTTAPASGGPATTAAPASAAASAVVPGATDPSPAGGPVVEGPGDLVLADATVGLEDLGGHTAALAESFEGTIDGAAASWRVVTTLIVTGTQSARRLTIEHDGQAPGDYPEAGTSILVDGALYRVDGETCSAGLADAAAASAFDEPAALLPGLVGASAAGSETIGGVAVDTFTFDGLALGIPDAASASGRLSLASADGHVVSYSTEIRGGPDELGEGWSGTFASIYELRDAGAPPPIDVPLSCPAGPIDFLVPTDARDVSSAPGSLRFTIAGTVAEAVAVVRGGSVLAHWTAGEAVVFEDQARLVFTADGLSIDANIFPADSGTFVGLVATRQ